MEARTQIEPILADIAKYSGPQAAGQCEVEARHPPRRPTERYRGVPRREANEGGGDASASNDRQIAGSCTELDRADQLELAQRLWQELFEHGPPPLLTDAERVLIDERLAAHEAAPGDTLSWDEVEARVLAELRGSR